MVKVLEPLRSEAGRACREQAAKELASLRSPLMRTAEEAAKRVAGWSPAKRDAAYRIMRTRT